MGLAMEGGQTFCSFSGERFLSPLYLPYTPLESMFIPLAPLPEITIPCMGDVCLSTRIPTYVSHQELHP